MSWIRPSEHLRPDWLPRAIVSGSVATIVMTLIFPVAYGLALLIAKTGFGGEVLAGWFDALAHNQVTDLTGDNLYVALAIHSAAGLMWAIIYAYFAEPRLGGPAWQNGAMFSLVPWLLSLVAFLPLVGGGLFGLSIGAGPLPTLGNLILHLVYGATLGVMYEPSGLIILEEWGTSDVDKRVELSAQKFASIGILIGIAVGAGNGVLAITSLNISAVADIMDLSPWYFFLGSVLISGSWGGLIGSMFGLTVRLRERSL